MEKKLGELRGADKVIAPTVHRTQSALASHALAAMGERKSHLPWQSRPALQKKYVDYYLRVYKATPAL